MIRLLPNPQPKEFDTKVQIVQKTPEMKTVEKTEYVAQVEEREETRSVPKSRVVMEEQEYTEMRPEVREVETTRVEKRPV